jgi:hypothetical protein
MPETGHPRHPSSFNLNPEKRVPFSPPDVQPSTMLRKIISGGQTGADRAGLDFAIEVGLVHGGSIPRGRKAETDVSMKISTRGVVEQLVPGSNQAQHPRERWNGYI